MKKLLLIAILSFSTIAITSCSSDRGEEATAPAQDFTNADYIKSKMIGGWNYWGYKNESLWIYNGDVFKGTFDFNQDNTYLYKDPISAKTQNGTYVINPVIGNTNAAIYLKYTENGLEKSRYITLKSLEGNIVTIYEKNWEERYQKR